MKKLTLALFLVGAVLVGAERQVVRKVALLQVLANPGRFHGMVVSIGGIYSTEVDASRLFLTKDHYQAYDEASSVLLTRIKARMWPDDKWCGRFIQLEGRFNFDEKSGVMAVTEIRNVMCLDLASRSKG